MKTLAVLLLLLLPRTASAGVSCWTIEDPDQRALCRATATRSRGNCSTISDYALRKQCEAGTGAPPSVCNSITDQWEREKCKAAAKQ